MSDKNSRRRNSRDKFSYGALEPRQLLAGDIYQVGIDPAVGATVTAFSGSDPRDPSDPWDIETNWIAAVEELALVDADEVNFAVFRQVANDGSLSGGAELVTVQSAVNRANELGLTVTILPVFETEAGWRGDYNPSGAEQSTFRSHYSDFVIDLAEVNGVDRVTVASELNAMVADASNDDFFDQLISSVADSSFEGEIGFTANFDAVDTWQHYRLYDHPDVDYLGVSAYGSVISAENASLIEGTGEVPAAVFDQMVASWNAKLDSIYQIANNYNIKALIQEFGSVKENYTAILPWAVSPGNHVASSLSDRFAYDPLEQKATYDSLLVALDGRADEFEAVHFWSWEHGADRGLRTYEGFTGGTQYINEFAVWPTDGAGGQAVTEFLATREVAIPADNLQAVDDLFANNGNNALNLDVLANDQQDADVIIDEVFNVGQGDVQILDDGTLDWELDFAFAEFIPADGLAGDRFGTAIAIDGNLAAIGSPFDDVGDKINTGSVYVYEFQGDQWQQVSKIVSPTFKNGDLFGSSVALQDGKLVVGAVHADKFGFNSGAAFVFEQGATNAEWTNKQNLVATNVRRGDRYGVSVAIDGDLISVGNRFGDGAEVNSGTVSVFHYKESFDWWIESSIVSTANAGTKDFGYQIDLSQNQLVVSAPKSGTATAYLYSLNFDGSEARSTELSTSAANPEDRFGSSVAIDGSRILVGASLYDHQDQLTNSGAAFAFDLDGTLTETIEESSPRQGNQFGFAVDIQNDSAAISAIAADYGAINGGSVYRYEHGVAGWTEANRYDSNVTDQLNGHAVAANSQHLLTSSIRHQSPYIYRGVIHSYAKETSTNAEVTFEYSIAYAAELLESGTQDDQFGWSVAIDGNWAIAGAPDANSYGSTDGGSAYVYRKSDQSWEFHSRLAESNLQTGDRFGHTVALEGGTLVVGAPKSDAVKFNSGSAFVYEFDGWNWQLKNQLTQTNANAGDQFGISVALDGAQLAVGAVSGDGATENSGTVSVFEADATNQWSLDQTILATSGQANDRFGWSVDIDDGILVVGAPQAERSGKAFVFRDWNGSWNQVASIAGTDSATGDQFGHSVSVNGNFIAVGAKEHDHQGVNNSGAAYLFWNNQFDQSGWQQTRKLSVEGQKVGDRLGTSVQLDDDRLVVSAPMSDAGGNDSGSVYVFDANDGWSVSQAIRSSNSGSRMGSSIGLSGDNLIAGSNFATVSGVESTVSIQRLGTSTAQVTLNNDG